MNIVILDGYTTNPGDLSWDFLRQFGEVTVYDRTKPAEIVERCKGAQIVVTNKTPLTKTEIDQMPKLQFVALLSTGYNVVDGAYLREKGVPLSNIPSYSTNAVAQLVFAFLTAFCNRVAQHSDAVRAGEWSACAAFCFWKAPLTELSGVSVVLCAACMGLMVGFDLIGPISMSAFAVAVAAFFDGNAQLMTIYGACFITIGWIPLMTVLLQKITKKGGKADTDDFNLAASGPINAFFENVKLTVAFSMPYAYRSPLTVIPGYMLGAAATGILTAAFGIVNTAYLTELPKYGNGETFAEMFSREEIYISFTLPLRSGDWLTCRIPLFFIILFGALVGGACMLLFKELAYRSQKKRGTYVETDGDMVLEFRRYAQKLWVPFKQSRGKLPETYAGKESREDETEPESEPANRA